MSENYKAAARSNYKRSSERLLRSIKIKCSKCDGLMIRVHDLYQDTVVGYSCKNCTHYYLFK